MKLLGTRILCLGLPGGGEQDDYCTLWGHSPVDAEGPPLRFQHQCKCQGSEKANKSSYKSVLTSRAPKTVLRTLKSPY